MMRVTIAIAGADDVEIRHLEIGEGATVAEALRAAGLAALTERPLGVYAHRVDAQHVLQEGDRIEIYRELVADPKEARRRRQARRREK